MDINKYDLVILDCDGVILNSNFVKLNTFNEIVKSFGEQKFNQYLNSNVNKLGVNRFDKVDFICKNILSVNKLNIKAKKEEILKDYNFKLKNRLKNVEMTNFFNNNLYNNLKDVIIVSAAYEHELKEVLVDRGLLKYISENKIFGSPKTKIENIKSYLNIKNYLNCLLIGDSKSDYDTAKEMEMDFYYIDCWSAEKNEVRNDLKLISNKYFNLLDDVFEG